jgi:tryptophanyl-tRNA synthetase
MEIAHDVAEAFNRTYGSVLRVPLMSDSGVATILGTDGRKMSKRYGNVIPLLAPRSELARRVRLIRTDSRRPEETKDPDTCPVFALYQHFASASDVSALRERYTAGGLGYSEAKAALLDAIDREAGPTRLQYAELRMDEEGLDHILASGAAAAREAAQCTMREVRQAVGLRRAALVTQRILQREVGSGVLGRVGSPLADARCI